MAIGYSGVHVLTMSMLKRSSNETPPRPVDKLFVPPTFAEAISQAIHAVCTGLCSRPLKLVDWQQQINAAQQMLEELWYRALFRRP
jgi:hypothetical protein